MNEKLKMTRKQRKIGKCACETKTDEHGNQFLLVVKIFTDCLYKLQDISCGSCKLPAKL